jgi:carboxymethylenebutenolidase
MKELTIKTADGEARSIEVGTGPSVLLIIDGLGWRPAMTEMAERLAGGGYRVLMPDMFYRAGAYAPKVPAQLMADAAGRAAWFQQLMGVPTEGYMADIATYLTHLPGNVGTTGYCFGGRMSIIAAEHFPDRIVAAAAYHPGGLVTDTPESPHLHVGKIKASVFVGGAEDDQSFTDAQRATLEKALSDAHVDHKVELFHAKHGWVPTDTHAYDKPAAEHHWDTLFALLKKKLPA